MLQEERGREVRHLHHAKVVDIDGNKEGGKDNGMLLFFTEGEGVFTKASKPIWSL